MKTKLISIFTLAICIILAGAAIAVPDSGKAGKDIGNLISKGESFFHKGDFEHAAKAWENVLVLLDRNQAPGIYMDTLEHLVHAYKAIGFHEKALSALTEALPVVEKSDNRYRNALFLNNLADTYLTLGNLRQAVRITEKAIAEAQLCGQPEILAYILNNTGNMLVMDGNYKEASDIYRECLNLLNNAEDSDELKAEVSVNAAYTEFLTGRIREFLKAFDEALQSVRNLPDSYFKAENYITLSLLATDAAAKDITLQKELAEKAYNILAQAKKTGENLDNPRIISQADGYMGVLYEKQGRFEESLRLTRSAAFFAQQGSFPELLYLWQWQTGRLQNAMQNKEQAVQSYKAAIGTLNPIRLELFRGYRSRKDAFDENIRPVYIGLANIYFKQADALDNREQHEEKLRQARDIMEILKRAELQNFYKDECVSGSERGKILSDQVPPHTAVIYPVSLEDRLVVLLGISDSITCFNIPVSSRELKKTAKLLRRRLQTRSSNRFIKQARNLYDWLIGPVEAHLAANEIDTLVVVPDGALRLIPFSSLYDGGHFLIEKYAVGTVPALSLTSSGTPGSGHAEILLSGISEGVQEFTPLPGVKDELEDVKKIMNARHMLLNTDFTIPRLTGEFKTNPFSILHMATHGVFGGTAKDSFLLTYDSRLDMNRLENLISLSRFREQKVELLTLSACQTAMGNERAAMGLAGVAVKAGVRTAIATLWFVDDEATSLTIREFYRQLGNTGLSKARALQNAQKKLISGERFWHPIYWSPFLLIGDWGKTPDISGTTDTALLKEPAKALVVRRRDSEASSRGLTRAMMAERKGELTRGLVLKQENKELRTAPPGMAPLVSETTSLCSKPRPALLWYISGPWPDKMEFRVNAPRSEEPVLDTLIKGPSSEGIYRTDLADYNISLDPGVEYEWFLTIVFDENNRSADCFISGTLMYKPLSDDLSQCLAGDPGDKTYSVYADAGYWYDAFDSLSMLIADRPGDRELRRNRANLLKKVNLAKIADYDIRQISGD
ncbi:MAG: CHAT domain-containing protein [Desulfobacterales bacterium]|nr:CHAT domain-containing protein [Desulfobacterales bacterium]